MLPELRKHRDQLIQNFLGTPQPCKVLFSLLCTDRLRACWWVFCRIYGWDFEFFSRHCDSIAAGLKTRSLPQVSNELIIQVREMIPHSEDFPTPLASQASYGLATLENTFRLCQVDDVELCAVGAINVLEAVGLYEYYASKAEGAPYTENDRNWLRQAEYKRQIAHSNVLANFDEQLVSPLRIENRLFAIPIACED